VGYFYLEGVGLIAIVGKNIEKGRGVNH